MNRYFYVNPLSVCRFPLLVSFNSPNKEKYLCRNKGSWYIYTDDYIYLYKLLTFYVFSFCSHFFSATRFSSQEDVVYWNKNKPIQGKVRVVFIEDGRLLWLYKVSFDFLKCRSNVAKYLS